MTEADTSLEALSVLGHELRRPLTVIRGAATLMLESQGQLDPATATQMLTLIDQNVEEMSDLIDDVLLMVHVEAGDLSLREEPVDVADLVATAVEAERRHTAEHPVTVLGAAPGLTVAGDRQRALRVLRALVHNAARFSPPGLPVEVLVGEREDQIRFEVQDRGPGIPAAARDAVFDRYRQLADGAAGIGLGLYLARRLARLMGGDAGIGDRPGGGTTAWFTLRRSG